MLLEKLLPTVSFYSGVHYKIIENGIEKKPELDILGVSTRATYIVEVKAHELTYKDRVGVEGAKQKFRNSVEEACSQSNRAKVSINTNVTPVFQVKRACSLSISLDLYTRLLFVFSIILHFLEISINYWRPIC